jgi:hypothetical protein
MYIITINLSGPFFCLIDLVLGLRVGLHAVGARGGEVEDAHMCILCLRSGILAARGVSNGRVLASLGLVVGKANLAAIWSDRWRLSLSGSAGSSLVSRGSGSSSVMGGPPLGRGGVGR